MKGFARCEYLECGDAAVAAIRLRGIATSDDGSTDDVELVIHYCAAHYAIVAENERRSDADYAELRAQGVSEKMANHITIARSDRARESH